MGLYIIYCAEPNTNTKREKNNNSLSRPNFSPSLVFPLLPTSVIKSSDFKVEDKAWHG